MTWLLGALLVSGAVVLGLSLLFPGTFAIEDQGGRLAYVIALLAIAGSTLYVSLRTEFKESVRSIAIWGAIGLGLVTAYTYADTLKQAGRDVGGALSPSSPTEAGETVSIRVSTGGHFVAHGHVNDARIRFLIDTGASQVVLTRSDARRAGFPINRLQYTDYVRTANGTTKVAPVRLKEVRVGSIILRNVRAQVAGDGLDQSLLGMTFLSRLESYEFSRRQLVLRQ